MDYEQKSDDEINFAVFHKLSGKVWDKELSLKVWNLLVERPDYCNNPSDAWPIILVNNISITKYLQLDDWEVFGGGVCVDYDHCIISNSDCSYSYKNPLRAAMIVFLMMNEGD